jgi:hypothetical protein
VSWRRSAQPTSSLVVCSANDQRESPRRALLLSELAGSVESGCVVRLGLPLCTDLPRLGRPRDQPGWAFCCGRWADARGGIACRGLTYDELLGS